MSQYLTREERTQRAFRACVDLLDTAEWLKSQMRGPLDSFDLAIGDFRLLELLYREGALTQPDIARTRRIKRQNVGFIIRRLAKRGWVGQAIAALPPVGFERAHKASSSRDDRRKGRRVSVIGLTKSGKRFIGNVLPTHSKFIKALMRALEAREQESLSRLCQKLRTGNPVGFFAEITHEDDD
jgi:DNA-binding MarR family transcriptional regulator